MNMKDLLSESHIGMYMHYDISEKLISNNVISSQVNGFIFCQRGKTSSNISLLFD